MLQSRIPYHKKMMWRSVILYVPIKACMTVLRVLMLQLPINMAIRNYTRLTEFPTILRPVASLVPL